MTEANAKRIREGMSRAWVERVLGGPPTLEGRLNSRFNFSLWDAGDGLVVVDFDPAGWAASASFASGRQARAIRNVVGLDAAPPGGAVRAPGPRARKGRLITLSPLAGPRTENSRSGFLSRSPLVQWKPV